MMQAIKLFLGLLALQIVAAHTVFTTLFVDGVDQGDGVAVRMPTTPNNCTSPVNDLASNDMACGYDGEVGVARIVGVNQGSKLTFQFREWADGSQPGALDSSHKGPCAVYMKAVTSAITDPGYGPGWFKIWDSGYDNTTSEWCTTQLIANNGLLSVDIPSDLAGGYYLVRPELLALHQADKTPPNPQFYTGCAQVFLNSSATSVPTDTVSIPGYVQAGDPSVDFNIYTPTWPYPMPGPTPYEDGTGANSNTNAVATNVKFAAVQTEGLEASDCILTNANWCGVELNSYSTEDGCWNASTACWAQDTICYSSAPPTGSKNCPIWDSKCTAIQAACNANNFNGPPNQGKNLNPPASTISFAIPAAASETLGDYTSVGDVESAAATATVAETTTTPAAVMTSATPSTTESSAASSSTSTSTPTTLSLSLDATCGLTTSRTCLGSTFGSCCSAHGWCGSSDAYCGDGCQSDFGGCGSTASKRGLMDEESGWKGPKKERKVGGRFGRRGYNHLHL